MTDTLFDLPDSPSPRIQWMRRHGVVIDEFAGRYTCFFKNNDRIAGNGNTADEALTDFAIKNNLKLWNEE